MTLLPRLKPAPLPRIHPVPELLADARLKAVYEDTKATLGVPWMGVVTMAFAHYPRFYATLWAGLRELCGSATFDAACRRLRDQVEAQAAALAPASLVPALTAQGYAERELDEIRALVEVFAQGNMPYLLLATGARLLLEGRSAGRPGPALARAARTGPAAAQRLTLIEPHHADAGSAAVFADIRATLGLPFVNTDYRALARWPSYFALAWGDLRGRLDSPAYAVAVQAIHDFAVALWDELAVSPALTPAALTAAAQADAPPGEVLEVVRLFQWLLPGLVSNVACFQVQLAAH
jgi:hypothetical protein